MRIRTYRPGDLDALYAIALATGDAGKDATALHADARLIGDVFAAPYAILAPDTCFVAEDDEGVAGYIVGAADTRAFEARLAAAWWPTLQAAHPDAPNTPREQWSPDERLAWLIHHHPRAPTLLVDSFPSHLHINLLPRLQGRGSGRRMMDRWLKAVSAMGSRGAHLGVNVANARAIRFYRAYGLREPTLPRPPPSGVLWFATALVVERSSQSIGSGPHHPGR